MEGKWPMTVLYSLYYEFSKRYPHSRITGMKQETACTKIELLFRMFNYTIGGDTFQKGLRMFIESRLVLHSDLTDFKGEGTKFFCIFFVYYIHDSSFLPQWWSNIGFISDSGIFTFN